MTYQPRYTPPSRSAAECLWLWPTVVMRAAPGQDRDFSLRIEQQALRPGWEPTPMQLDLMRRAVALDAANNVMKLNASLWVNSNVAKINAAPGGG